MTQHGAQAAPEHDTIEDIAPPAATFCLHGHTGPWDALVAAEAGGRMHHAWLLQGPRGIGKATAAFAFARRLLGCAPADVDAPDRPCVSADDPLARQIAQGSHPSLIHLTRPEVERGTGFRAQVTVDEIRKLNRFFRTTAADGWRIAIIDPADDLNRNAANALLKILEEPPDRSIFLITNHLPGRLLATIRSRCRVLRFEPLEPTVIASVLADIAPDFATAEVDAAVKIAGGSVRKAITLIVGGGAEIDAHLATIWGAKEPDWIAIQGLADVVTQKGRDSAYDLLVAGIFQRLAEDAQTHAGEGRIMAARRLAELWSAESERLREGVAFNLDRKQMLLTFFARLFELRLHGSEGG